MTLLTTVFTSSSSPLLIALEQYLNNRILKYVVSKSNRFVSNCRFPHHGLNVVTSARISNEDQVIWTCVHANDSPSHQGTTELYENQRRILDTRLATNDHSQQKPPLVAARTNQLRHRATSTTCSRLIHILASTLEEVASKQPSC